MAIQSLSICCPSKNGKCINHCKTCTARQHTNPYRNKYDGTKCDTFEYWNDTIKRMEHAIKKGCTTLMLTGSNEPQQNRRWLEALYLAMRALPEPFVNIEIQTTGAFIDMDYLKFLKSIGVTTIAISTFNIFDDEKNRFVEECADKTLCLEELCNNAYSLDLNVRICVNVTDYVFDKDNERYTTEKGLTASSKSFEIFVQKILDRCSELHADQVTFRKMWSNPGTEEAKWIEDNCEYSEFIIKAVDHTVIKNGSLIQRLPYGAAQYDYKGFSIVVDVDSMAKDTTNNETKYYIIRENGKMYSSWDSKAALVF